MARAANGSSTGGRWVSCSSSTDNRAMKQHPAQPPSSPAAQVRRKRSRFSKHTIASRPAPHRLLVAQPSNSAAPEQGVHQRWLHPALSQCLVHIARLLAALGWLLGRLGLAHGSMGQCSIWAAAITAGPAAALRFGRRSGCCVAGACCCTADDAAAAASCCSLRCCSAC